MTIQTFFKAENSIFLNIEIGGIWVEGYEPLVGGIKIWWDGKCPIQAYMKGYMITNNNIGSSLSYSQTFPVCQKMFCLS